MHGRHASTASCRNPCTIARSMPRLPRCTFAAARRRIIESDPELNVVAEASSGTEAISLAEQHRPDIAVMDIAMKELNGIEAASQIQKCSPETAILILSMFSDERYIMRAVKAGARG